MKRALIVALCLVAFGAKAKAVTLDSAGLTSEEEHRRAEFQKRLCADRDLDCEYVKSVLNDPRLTIYHPPEPAPPPPTTPVPREHERNPYFTKRFGLLVPASLERCRDFIEAHSLAFDAAYRIYGVPKEIICGHLRIETDFGVPTPLSPHPLGTVPAIDRLVSLYVRKPTRRQRPQGFAKRQKFALNECKDLLLAAKQNGWDLYEIPGSPTGAIGLLQFEPSSFKVAVDGDGDGKIDLFDPEDAILSVAHYLVTRGWDEQPMHQQRAVYAYYGGHYETDRNKFYMKAVLKFASEMTEYLQDHPLETAVTLVTQPQPPGDQQTTELHAGQSASN